MRYAPSERLFRLARLLAGTRVGLTLDEMGAELGVGRRTAERLRDALISMFPEMNCYDDERRARRWRLPGSALIGVVAVPAQTVAAVEISAKDYDMRSATHQAELLRDASTSLRAMMQPQALRRAEPDIAALMEAEGIAMRPGPRPLIAPEILPVLRRAILGMQLVHVQYARHETKGTNAWCICPYAILHGGRGWLVGHVNGFRELRLWRLDRIASAELLDGAFARRDDFDLAAYAAQSFGVFQEEPIDVHLRFAPEAATDVARWMFHPSQSITREKDGSMTVCFRAGGIREICWHLFTWGTAVKIVSPPELREALRKMALEASLHHSTMPQ